MSPSFRSFQSAKMSFFLETLQFVYHTIYYLLEAFLRLFVRPRRKNVTGEVVLITGAGSGIGRLIAVEFAKLGASLVLWDINEEGNRETARLAKEKGAAKVQAYPCDCSDRAVVYRVADQVIMLLACPHLDSGARNASLHVRDFVNVVHWVNAF